MLSARDMMGVWHDGEMSSFTAAIPASQPTQDRVRRAVVHSNARLVSTQSCRLKVPPRTSSGFPFGGSALNRLYSAIDAVSNDNQAGNKVVFLAGYKTIVNLMRNGQDRPS
jgi:hypothetical protein